MECIALCSEQSRIACSLRFLQLVSRNTGEREWQEAIEQRFAANLLSVSELTHTAHLEHFSFPGGEDETAGVVRRRCALHAQIEISAVHIRDNVFRLTIRAGNTTGYQPQKRDGALLHSLASAHAVLHIENGEFVSQTDAPDEFQDAAAGCQNTGVWPVLVGEMGARTTMLGAPIILYDYPQIAPESKGDLFDGTEIDEILILRILTLTDEEKEEMRRSDEHARRILERLETTPPEHFIGLHGTIRNLQNKNAAGFRSEFKKGDRVRLRPRKRADIFDTLLEGKIAIIEAVEEDFEGNIHFAVVIEEDPGRDLGEMRQAGHRFFFSTQEVERP